MSFYGSAPGSVAVIARTEQSSEATDLTRRVRELLAGLPVGYVVLTANMLGAGDGATFVVQVEAAPAAVSVGGLAPANLAVQAFDAGDGLEFQKARNFAAGLLFAANPGKRLIDVLEAGASQGTRMMGLLMVSTDATSGGGACCNPISWRLDGTGDAQTWDEVMAFVDASTVPVEIYVSGDLTYPIPARVSPYDMKHAGFFANLGEVNIVAIADGAVLHNLASAEGGVIVQGGPTTGPCLTFLSATPGMQPPVLRASRGGGFSNVGTVPMIEVPAADFLVFVSITIGAYTGTPGIPFINLGAGATLLVLNLGGFNFGQPDPVGFISGPVGSTLLWAHDGGMNFPPPTIAASFFGTQANVAIGNVGGAGPTSFRPASLFDPVSLGCTYFDTDLVPPIPIWWNGSIWVDATGAGPV